MQVDWTRDPDPTPPPTFTVTLTKREAEILLEYTQVGDDAATFRLDNGLIYILEDSLRDVLRQSN